MKVEYTGTFTCSANCWSSPVASDEITPPPARTSGRFAFSSSSSARATASGEPGVRHSIRASYNRAFRSPSSVNNFLDQQIVVLTPDLSPLRPFLPPPLQPFATRLPLVVNNVGNPGLKEESLTAYELAYTGSVGRTTFGFAVYQNDQDDNINFTQLSPGMPGYVPYTPQDPPPGIPGAFIAVLGAIPPQLAAHHLELSPDGCQMTFTYDTKAGRTGITALLNDMRTAGLGFADLATTQSSLEDIFVDLVRGAQ